MRRIANLLRPRPTTASVNADIALAVLTCRRHAKAMDALLEQLATRATRLDRNGKPLS